MYGANAKTLVSYSNTSLVDLGKKGLLKKTPDGYYIVCVGALDYPNNMNDIYDGKHYRDSLFNPHGVFQRRMSKGVLYGEWNHPKREPNMGRNEWFSRLLDISEDRICCHIRKVEVVDGLVDRHGNRFCGVVVELKPLGPFGNALQSILDTPDVNSFFSVRSFTQDTPLSGMSGGFLKRMQECVTFDFVTEGGIEAAQKHNSPGLESFSTAEILEFTKPGSESGVGLESFGIDPYTLCQRLGAYGRTLQDHKSLQW